ncbi:hypothetical protein TD95_002444 [Thielaviopsis punctulata]|uniref:TEL2-interacting protein 1 n=1 Tax=Thielaviopsis punctulata TaxID=72032 RepID=A0A0F4Z8M6_9PEZI|nr:hypothetical protein TD95_002444 [Thielaviopsis punctulata]
MASQNSGHANAARTEFFQQIKPCCISLSKTASKSVQTAADSRFLTTLVQELLDHLSAQTQRDSTVFDKNLADYIFFPLAFIFKNQEQHPITLVELTLRCLTILIFHGWKANIDPKLVQQLLLFLTFVIGGVPTQQQKRDTSEEAILESLKALNNLVTAAGKSAEASAALVDATGIPALGHAITVLLQCVSEGKTPEIQTEAMKTLRTFFSAIRDDAALASFLPGTVSSLTKVVSTPAREKRRVLVGAVNTLKEIITRVLGDMRTRVLLMQLEKQKENISSHNAVTIKETAMKEFDMKDDGDVENTKEEEEDKGRVWTPSWLRATADQIKLALSTILKLAKTDEEEVRSALERFCISLLDECHKSLANCASILVEAAMALSDEKVDNDLMTTSLTDLALVYPELSDCIKTAVYNWVTGLPRVMQSADEAIRRRGLQNLKRGLHLASTMNFASPTLNNAVSAALRDGIIQLMINSKMPKVVDEVETMELLSGNAQLVTTDSRLSQFRPVMLPHQSQVSTRVELLDLIKHLGTSSQQTKLAIDMLEQAQVSVGDAQISSYWLSLELLKSALDNRSDLDAFISFSDVPEEAENAFNDLYAFAVSVLDSQSDFQESDWRLDALALETVAYAASRSKKAFRPELIDVLFPICSFLGSDNVQLRHHAIVGLNSVAASCGYGSVSDLIIDNADYMVNSVSLRLNTLSITPATNKVMLMVVRLAGPKLVPFLDDVVTSIFFALDNYHGYPAFVEGLFGVLNEVVSQGVKSDKLLIEGGPAEDMPIEKTKHSKHWATIDEVKQTLEAREKKRRQRQKEDMELDASVRVPHPKKPWKMDVIKNSPRIQELLDDADEAIPKPEPDENDQRKLGGDYPEDVDAPTDPPKPPPTPTYAILSKIAELTQHYLTSPTPTLRKSLLDLLATVSPALAHDATAFLPLVNAVWPVIIQRLYDAEAYIAIAACETLGALCAAAGDFMSSRFKDEWASRMYAWVGKVKGRVGRAQGRGGAGDVLVPGATGVKLEGVVLQSEERGLGQFAQSAKMWEAVVRMLVMMLRHVRVADEMYDQVLELLVDRLGDEDVREALETINPDAVWLAMYLNGQVTEELVAPTCEGVQFLALGDYTKV